MRVIIQYLNLQLIINIVAGHHVLFYNYLSFTTYLPTYLKTAGTYLP